MSAPPLLTIIIPFWNSEKYLPECLRRLSLQTFRDFEIVIVNNGSSQTAVARLRSENLHIKHLESNLGFAAANNIGARFARGKWIALLNADAFPESDWLARLIEAAENHPEFTCFASRQIQANMPEYLDGAGDAYHISGLAWRRNYNKPAANHGLVQEEVFSPCAAAALYLRDDFLQAGGFDEDYFSYFEDVDLGIRLRLSGKKSLYVSEAVVHHVGSASTGKRSDFAVYYGYRNMVWTFFKNIPSPLLWFFLPLHILSILFIVFNFTLNGQGKVIIRAVFDAILGLSKAIKKRKIIQKNVKIKPRDLLKVMSTSLFEPYREFIERNKE